MFIDSVGNFNSSNSVSVVFVTTSAPFSGQAEIFVLDELENFREISSSFWVMPVRRRERRPVPSALESGLVKHVISPAIFSLAIGWAALRMLGKRPLEVVRQIVSILRYSGGVRNLANNLISFPKALWLAGFVRANKVEHIHAYWLSHTATIAMVASKLAGVPWSGTGYRWDIDSNNHMRAKFASAAFLRCADELGMDSLSQLRTDFCSDTKLTMVRTGVHLPNRNSWSHIPVDTNRFVCAGAFVQKKQQELLVRAFALHLQRYPTARLELIGDGALRHRVAEVVDELGIGASVVFSGTLPLEQLRALLRKRPVSVLPSIITEASEQEGIPVVLIEAMANGSPVISTPTGSIASLVLEQCGLLVEPSSLTSLAAGLGLVASEPHRAEAWANQAYARLGAEFDGTVCARRLAELIASTHRSTAAP